MNGTAAIETNRTVLIRIVANLVDLAASFGAGAFTSALRGGRREASGGDRDAKPAFTLPRRLRLVILRLLRPAESAARRLIIAAARGLAVTLPPARPSKPKPTTMEPPLRALGIAVMASPDDIARAAAARRIAQHRAVRPRGLSFSLVDPPRRLFGVHRRSVPAHAAPRILWPGDAPPFPLPRPPSAGDPVDAAHVGQRLVALAAALDDLPGQARRFARWCALRDRALAREGALSDRFRRVSPLRAGRPPGSRPWIYDPGALHSPKIREVDEIAAHAHALALFALEPPDTS